MHKLAGALSERGHTLEYIKDYITKISKQIGTISVSLSGMSRFRKWISVKVIGVIRLCFLKSISLINKNQLNLITISNKS